MKQRLIWNFELALDESLSLGNLVDEKQDELKWEVRFFWTEDQIITLSTTDRSMLDISNYQQKHKDDYYYVIPDLNYNLKKRRNELLYKPVLKQTKSALGFGHKINLDDERHYPDQDEGSVLHLKNIATIAHERGIVIFVKKEVFMYKFTTIPTTKLELDRIEINNKIYFSACIEGKSLFLVEKLSKYLLGDYISCDYVTFLKTILKI